MPELSDDELKKLPPAIREGYEKARDKGKGAFSSLGDIFGGLADGISEDRLKNLNDIIEKAKKKNG